MDSDDNILPISKKMVAVKLFYPYFIYTTMSKNIIQEVTTDFN